MHDGDARIMRAEMREIRGRPAGVAHGEDDHQVGMTFEAAHIGLGRKFLTMVAAMIVGADAARGRHRGENP